MDAHPASIRTPDQRIRVFLSSTLRELEPEREAARAAIESLHLAPVMFELGARPHPPRSLYRSYLAQSDIFVAVYWQSYGWVAPDEEISGLEDEYRLAGGLPHLIYIKQPAPDREPRLDQLLDRVRGDDASSYRSFETPQELAELIVADIATLLADRFDASRASTAKVAADSALSIPAPFSSLVGRQEEQRELLELLAAPGVRIVTVVGPGGIGKSRLAIEIAETLAATGREVAFAALETLTVSNRVISVIARAVGVRDGGDDLLEAKVITALAGRDMLLVVDNMEHLLDATDVLVRLITALPRLQLLVTSRSPLRVRAERTYELGPLLGPDGESETIDAATSPAFELFVQRATAVNPGFEVTPVNTPGIAGIVRALDGVPLGIELAAARTRTLSPSEILERLDSALSLLVSGARDLPERQRAVRSTIEWSVRLLDPATIVAFNALSALSGPFTIDAAEAVLAEAPGASAPDAFTAIESLIDASLLWQRDRDGVRVFGMLALVRAFAREQAQSEPAGAAAAREQWVLHYLGLAREADVGLRGEAQLDWMRRLNAQAENILAVMRELLNEDRFDEAAEYGWSLYLYVWISGLLGLVRDWMTELLDRASRAEAALAPRTEAIALYFTRAITYWYDPGSDVLPGLRSSVDLFEQSDDAASAALTRVSIALALLSGQAGPDLVAARTELEIGLEQFRSAGNVWGQAMTLVAIGRIDLATQDVTAAAKSFDESFRLATAAGEMLGIVIAQHNRGWPKFFAGDLAGAEADFAEALDGSRAMRHDEGVVYGVEGLATIRAAQGNAEQTGLLLGAASRLRRRTGIVNQAGFNVYDPLVATIRANGASDALDAAIAIGEDLSVAEVLARVTN